MFTFKQRASMVAAVVSIGVGCQSHDRAFDDPARYDLGSSIPDDRIKLLITAIPPDGEGLPVGNGSFEIGKKIYRTKCESCHGKDLTGTRAARALIGGQGTLTTDSPLKTVESYWPYATSVFSYVRNTMPTTAPGSLTDSEVYALMAYILGSANIVSRDIVLDRNNLPAIVMPNRNGFVPDPRPDVWNFAL